MYGYGCGCHCRRYSLVDTRLPTESTEAHLNFKSGRKNKSYSIAECLYLRVPVSESECVRTCVSFRVCACIFLFLLLQFLLYYYFSTVYLTVHTSRVYLPNLFGDFHFSSAALDLRCCCCVASAFKYQRRMPGSDRCKRWKSISVSLGILSFLHTKRERESGTTESNTCERI